MTKRLELALIEPSRSFRSSTQSSAHLLSSRVSEALAVFAALAMMIALSLFLSGAVRADEQPSFLSGFTTDKFADTEKAINSLATSGLPMASAILEALASDRLVFDPETKTLLIRKSESQVIGAADGQILEDIDVDTLKKVRINNAVRRALDAALGSLTLMSPDPIKRLSAAESAYKTHEPAALDLLQQAIDKESDAKVKRMQLAAKAAIQALDPQASDADRLSAIEIVKARGDQDALSLLAKVAASSEGSIKAAAESAVTSIRANLALWNNVQNIWYGLSLGSVLLLAAIGLAITFGVMGIINMAHGEMVMIGAYTTYVVQEIIRTKFPALFDYSLLMAVPLAFAVTAIIGMAIERVIIRYLYGRPLETLLATFGLSLVLQQAVRTIFGANNREVGAPSFMAGSFDFGGLVITSGRMWIIVFALMVFGVLQLVLRATSFGLRMRAVTQNRKMASAMGIDTNRIDALAFGLGSGIAGLAGVALSQIDNVSPNLGQSYIIDSFMVVVFGGVGNLWGTLVGALTLGVANKVLEPFIGAVLGKIVMLIFIIMFIQKRPRGLFALKGRAVEA